MAGVSFGDLCKDFDNRRPKGPIIGRVPFFKTKWDKDWLSVNDLLRRFLIKHQYEYINTFNGTVWFLFRGNWRRCTYEVDGDDVQFYMYEFIDN